MAARGYPGSYERGSVIEGLDDAAAVEGVEIFHAGTKAEGGRILANGGRVLNVSALGKNVGEARTRAYEAISRIRGRRGSIATISAGARSSGKAADGIISNLSSNFAQLFIYSEHQFIYR